MPQVVTPRTAVVIACGHCSSCNLGKHKYGQRRTSSRPCPQLLSVSPIFQGAVHRSKSPAAPSLTFGVEVALNELWTSWHRIFMPKLKLCHELISVRVSSLQLLSPSNKTLNSHFLEWKTDEGFCKYQSYRSEAFSRHCDTNSMDPLFNEWTVFPDQGWDSQEGD